MFSFIGHSSKVKIKLFSAAFPVALNNYVKIKPVAPPVISIPEATSPRERVDKVEKAIKSLQSFSVSTHTTPQSILP